MNNGRFAISVHILTLLAQEQQEWLSSNYVASSININPVLVRKELINLREQGLILSKEGNQGGSKLAVSAHQITMADIYKAVRQADLLGKAINEPNTNCPIGKKINKNLGELYHTVEQNLINQLEQTSLASFYEKFD
jgi:Rrf2 family protein